MKDHTYYVYILSNPKRTVLYIGITSSLVRRLDQHIEQKKKKNSFASKYNCGDIIYFEVFQYVNDAIAREKQLKKWSRAKKDKLINANNPDWKCLNPNFQVGDLS